VIRYFTNFICKDKNRRRTSRPYALLKNKNISNTSFFHTPLFKVMEHPQYLMPAVFFKRTGTRDTSPCRFSSSRQSFFAKLSQSVCTFGRGGSVFGTTSLSEPNLHKNRMPFG
jgi:hypothetical protein